MTTWDGVRFGVSALAIHQARRWLLPVRQQQPAPSITVLAETNTVRFEWPAAAFGDVHDWRGLRLYATTWDYDGGYRALDAAPGAMTYGGGTPTSPRIMDASAMIEWR